MAEMPSKDPNWPSTSGLPDCPYCPPPPEFRIPEPPEPFEFWTDDFLSGLQLNGSDESQLKCDLMYNESAIDFAPAIAASSWFSFFTEDIVLLIIGVVILTVMAVAGIGLLVHFNRARLKRWWSASASPTTSTPPRSDPRYCDSTGWTYNRMPMSQSANSGLTTVSLLPSMPNGFSRDPLQSTIPNSYTSQPEKGNSSTYQSIRSLRSAAGQKKGWNSKSAPAYEDFDANSNDRDTIDVEMEELSNVPPENRPLTPTSAPTLPCNYRVPSMQSTATQLSARVWNPSATVLQHYL